MIFSDKGINNICMKYKLSITILNLKKAISHYKELRQAKKEIKIQDSWDLSELINAKKLILFLTPADKKLNGGIMSIFSLCEASRKINNNALCILSTFPNDKYTYAYNNTFKNNEKIYRFSQIVDKCKNLEEAIIHIPEYYSKDFYTGLTSENKEFLKSIKDLQINILNQNIQHMPEPQFIQDLYLLTNNITQTIAHNRYATQEVCDKWNMPTHLFSVNLDLSRYKTYRFEEKEKIIALSPDKHALKDSIIQKLKKDLKGWKLVIINKMTFSEYMDTISKAYATITFGEGMDGYFIQPLYVGSLGMAVYNDNFFPDNSWNDLKNVYTSYEEMKENICSDIVRLSSNSELYYEVINKQLEKLNTIYTNENYSSYIENFYKREYNFIPNSKE